MNEVAEAVRAPAPAMPAPPATRDRLWLLLLWLAVTACNIAKPFHIDDTAHLEIARWIAAHPLHPMSGILNWNGVDEPIWATNQPHLYFYLMAAWGALFGYGEVAMHLLASLAAAACTVLFHRLARRFFPAGAVWLTAMLILGPAFVVNQNMMVDVPLLASWLLFFNALLLGADGPHQGRRYALAGTAVAIGVLIKYSSLVLVPVLIGTIVIERRWRCIAALAIPVAGVALWSWFNVWDYGGVHIAARTAGSPDRLRPIKFAIAWVLIVGGITPLGIVAAAALGPLRRHQRAIYIAAGLLFAALYLGVAGGWIGEAVSDALLWLGFAANGTALLVSLVAVLPRLAPLVTRWRDTALARANAPLAMLCLWVAGTVSFYILFPPFSATRHVLLIVPALLLLFAMLHGARLSRAARLFALVATAGISLGLAAGDYAFADFYRGAARELGARLDFSRPVWTSGHWGWQWYAGNVGMRQVDYRRTRFSAGDTFVEAPDIDHQYPTGRLRLRHLATLSQPRSLASVFCTARRSRFYMSSSRFGPWSLTRDCQQHLDVYRLAAPYP